MKTILAALLLFLASPVFAAPPAYTLHQICANYQSNKLLCQQIPFCISKSFHEEGKPAGCFPNPGFEWNATGCANISDPSLCVGGTAGGCYWTDGTADRDYDQCQEVYSAF